MGNVMAGIDPSALRAGSTFRRSVIDPKAFGRVRVVIREKLWVEGDSIPPGSGRLDAQDRRHAPGGATGP